jgi:hypothetical protein
MKLRKEELKDLLNAQMEWHLDNAEFLRSQGFSGKENDDLYERYEAILNNLEDGTLEIEGYKQMKDVDSIDGKPLSEGEVALIRAIRRGTRLIDPLRLIEKEKEENREA